jgi:hypothetical protein
MGQDRVAAMIAVRILLGLDVHVAAPFPLAGVGGASLWDCHVFLPLVSEGTVESYGFCKNSVKMKLRRARSVSDRRTSPANATGSGYENDLKSSREHFLLPVGTTFAL